MSDMEEVIRREMIDATYAGRTTPTLCNKVIRSFYPQRRKTKFLLDESDNTYPQWMRSVIVGKYDDQLLGSRGFGNVALVQLKEFYAREIELQVVLYQDHGSHI